MPQSMEWEIPSEFQPKPEDFDFDLDRTLSGVLGLQATVPQDAFTAGTLGTERAGSAVLIRKDGLVLTIGYLITEAESLWLTSSLGGAVPGHVLGYDPETGLGLVQALGRLSVPPIEMGTRMRVGAGDHAILAAEGGRRHAVAATIVARQEFAGYWEYLLDRAIFTAPAHPFWGGAGLSERGPASKTGLKAGDRILAVRDEPVSSLASFWRRVWASGPAGSEVVLQVVRDNDTMRVRIPSADRSRLLKAPLLH